MCSVYVNAPARVLACWSFVRSGVTIRMFVQIGTVANPLYLQCALMELATDMQTILKIDKSVVHAVSRSFANRYADLPRSTQSSFLADAARLSFPIVRAATRST